ncbi:MAG: prepilin-type N-terminal cleavage/methylation domain-containing protein [Legionellales bacterium]
MNQHKGFSLLEVLLSLMLASTVVLALLAEQQQSKQFLNQLIVHTDAAQFVESADENFLINDMAIAPSLHALKFTQSNNHSSSRSDSIVRHDWFKYWDAVIQHRSLVGLLK